MDTTATEVATADSTAIDDLTWDDWTPAEVCSIENGPDCEACEG